MVCAINFYKYVKKQLLAFVSITWNLKQIKCDRVNLFAIFFFFLDGWIWWVVESNVFTSFYAVCVLNTQPTYTHTCNSDLYKYTNRIIKSLDNNEQTKHEIFLWRNKKEFHLFSPAGNSIITSYRSLFFCVVILMHWIRLT